MEYFLHLNDLPNSVELSETISVDTETTGLNLWRDRLCLVQICTGNDKAHLVRISRNCQPAPNIEKLLSNKDILKIFHYGRFDIAVLKKHFKCQISSVYCTKIASKLARTSSDQHGLKHLVKEFVGVDIPKIEQTSDWGKENFSESQLKYAASDVIYLHQIREKLDKILVRENRNELAKQFFDFLPVIASLDINGWSPEQIWSH